MGFIRQVNLIPLGSNSTIESCMKDLGRSLGDLNLNSFDNMRTYERDNQ